MQTKRIRGRRLQEIRKRHLSRNPLCVICERKGILRPAVEVDHIIALCNGGEEEPSNRQSLCKACHDIKTRQDKGQGPSAACDVNGLPIDPAHAWS